MNYIVPLFKLSFWFDFTPPPLLPIFYWLFLLFFLLLIVASMVCGWMYKNKQDRYLVKFGAKYLKPWFLSSGILGLLLLLFNYERASFLSSRFWYILWVIGFGVWLFFIIKKIKRLPEKKEMLHKKAQFEKYLPKRRK